jgi:glycosyltransferase involved in cell wall biosynthesis
MKVLLITATVGERSGWGRYSKAVLEGLLRHGQQVEVFAQTHDRSVDVVYHELKPLSARFNLFSVLVNIRRVRRTARDFDVIHALDAWPFGIYGYGALLGRRGKKLFINGVGTYSVAPLYDIWKSWIVRRAYERAQKIFCISRYTERRIAERGISPERLTTVLMGRTALPILSADDVTEFRNRHSIQKDRKVILTVGAIKDRKGQLETLKAVAILRERYPDILYVIIGSVKDGPYVSSIKAYVLENGLRDNLLIVSDADDKALSFFYSICTVFALNSNTDQKTHHLEGFGLVIVEACQFGKPSVGSSDCGIEDAIKDGETGYWTRQRDPADIAAKIEQILQNYDYFSKNSSSWYTAFDWNKTVSAYIYEYEKKA